MCVCVSCFLFCLFLVLPVPASNHVVDGGSLNPKNSYLEYTHRYREPVGVKTVFTRNKENCRSWVCVSLYIHIYIYIYLYLNLKAFYIYVYIFMFMFIFIFIVMFIFTFIFKFRFRFRFIFLFLFIFVFIFIFIFLYVCMHIKNSHDFSSRFAGPAPDHMYIHAQIVYVSFASVLTSSP